ncbi:MAG: sugar-transfer associated ATP-grasp domain-containing protein [Bacteroidales bacterium]|nr:sugar-transfer associated ATP-grasp domain-containing protein [Bacteroidales bacterium]
MDHRLFEDFAVIPLVTYVSGMFFGPDMQKLGTEEVKSIMSEYNGLIVIKQEAGRGGKQIQFVHSNEFSAELLRKDRNYVIQPIIKQYKALNELYPDSVNTFRVTTFLGHEGNVSVKFVALRFGSDGSKVDNLTSGGQFVYFSPEGVPSEVAYVGKLLLPDDGRHKNTGFAYRDLKIPVFDKILEKCKFAHLQCPYLRIIGWDVCVTETGEPKLLEWNAFSPALVEVESVFGPFWPDQKEIDELDNCYRNVEYY